MTPSPFTAAELRPFETALRERLTALTSEVRQLADTFAGVQEARGDGSTDGAHDAEASSLRTEWSRLSGFQGEFAAELAAIDRALARMDAGSYGVCIRGGENIAPARLEAKPASELCIACAQALENSRRR